MISPELWAAFLLAAISYAVVPGPGTVYIAAQAVTREPGAALWGALGLHVGGYVIVFGSAAGLTVLFSAVPVIYEGLKLLGAAYIVWLGFRMIFRGSRTEDEGQRAPRKNRHPVTFSQGVLVEILNPTTVVFYVAFLPQFIAPDGSLPVWSQFLVLGVLVNVIFSLGDILTILVAVKLRAKASGSELVRRISGWIGGTVLVAMGMRLAADRG